MRSSILFRRSSLARKIKGVGIAAAVVVGGLVAIRVIGFVLGVVGVIASLIIPGVLLFGLAYLAYIFFLKE